jgi:hypothetical protein
VLCCAVLCCAVLCCAVLCCAVQAGAAAAEQLGPVAAPFFTAAIFLRFERDGAGAVSLPLLAQYVGLRAASMRLVRRQR